MIMIFFKLALTLPVDFTPFHTQK